MRDFVLQGSSICPHDDNATLTTSTGKKQNGSLVKFYNDFQIGWYGLWVRIPAPVDVSMRKMYVKKPEKNPARITAYNFFGDYFHKWNVELE